MNEPTIRTIQPSDTPGIHALIARIFLDYDYVLDVENEDAHLSDPCTYFRDGGGEFWVVEDQGTIVGCCGVRLNEDGGELKALYVAHEFRRKGLARRLCRMVIDYTRASGRKRVILWTDTRFTQAHRLYESLGFERTGKREISITNSFSEFGYELMLGERDA